MSSQPVSQGADCNEQDGRCKCLDASADGYMRGEGCIVHLMETFEPEELAGAQQTTQAMVLDGTAVNQDGRSSSLTVSAACCFLSPCSCTGSVRGGPWSPPEASARCTGGEVPVMEDAARARSD